MFDPNLGRWMQQDPIGFDAGDVNLYRSLENNPTSVSDPDGLQTHHPSRPAIWRWDWPGVSTEGDIFCKSWSFGEDEELYFKRGCVGLCAIRTGSYSLLKDPQYAPGVECFVKLEDALKRQGELSGKIKENKEVLKKAVVFTIETKDSMKDYIEYLDDAKSKVKPTCFDLRKMEPYDFATCFQKADGAIVYWERMPWGTRQNPKLIVNRTVGPAYSNVVYCVVVSDSKFQPHTVVPDDNINRKKR